MKLKSYPGFIPILARAYPELSAGLILGVHLGPPQGKLEIPGVDKTLALKLGITLMLEAR